MSWTDELEARLRVMLVDGHSFSVIAGELGISRNAAIGKAHRLGLTSKNPPHANGGPKRRKRAHTTQMTVKRIVAPSQGDGLKELPPDKSDNPVRLLELQAAHCRWPLGAGTATFFCGDPVVHERPYCERHCRVAYRPAREPSNTTRFAA